MKCCGHSLWESGARVYVASIPVRWAVVCVGTAEASCLRPLCTGLACGAPPVFSWLPSRDLQRSLNRLAGGDSAPLRPCPWRRAGGFRDLAPQKAGPLPTSASTWLALGGLCLSQREPGSTSTLSSIPKEQTCCKGLLRSLIPLWL